jgi:hypothetical protein
VNQAICHKDAAIVICCKGGKDGARDNENAPSIFSSGSQSSPVTPILPLSKNHANVESIWIFVFSFSLFQTMMEDDNAVLTSQNE